MELRFFVCRRCRNIIAYVQKSGVPVMCCGEPMKEIIPNTVDAAKEKHLPVYTVDGTTVRVQIGEFAHPMTEPHHIDWVVLQTKQGNQRKELAVGTAPVVCFSICPDDEVEAVLAYCNLHGLWKA